MERKAKETYGILQTTFGPSCMNRATVFEWHKRFKEGREYSRDAERFRRSMEVNRPELIGQGYYVEVLREFRKRICRKRPALFKSGQWHFQRDNASVHNSIHGTDYLTKRGIKIVPQPPYSPDFWLFPMLRVCRYETIEEMKEAMTKAIDTLTQEDFHGAF